MQQVDRGDSAMQKFYSGRVVLVTGGTGFMGKVIIEKLLRSTAVSSVFLMVRCKKGKTVDQRVHELFDDNLFAKVKETVKDYRERIRAVEGDASLPGMGLREEDRELLQAEVEVVFHGAATVRFDETLVRAVVTNVRGTREILQLARQCVKLKAFVHISTAYANCTQNEIKEEWFEPPITGDNAIQLINCLNEQQLTAVTSILCGEYPNTYAFTKAVAEDTVRVYGQGLPVVVFRPSIVVATAKEPITGWIDNVYGPTGVQCGVGAGLLRTLQFNESLVADLVPVDLAVNAAIASAWDISQTRSQEMPIYNYVSSCENPLLWRQFTQTGLRYGRENPTVKAIWYFTLTGTKFWMVFMVYQMLLHLIPALIVDFILLITGKKPRMWDIYRKIRKFSTLISYFSLRQWKFHNSRVVQLWKKMSEEDKILFNFDIATLDWDEFIKNSISGIRIHIFKDTSDTLPAALRKQFCFRILHHTLQTLFVAGVISLIWQLSLRILGLFSNTS